MTKQNPSNGISEVGATLDQLSAIRQILMGEQIKTTDVRLQELEERIETLQRALQKAEKSLQKNLTESTEALSHRLDETKDSLKSDIRQTALDAANRADQDRNRIGLLLIELGKSLME